MKNSARWASVIVAATAAVSFAASARAQTYLIDCHTQGTAPTGIWNTLPNNSSVTLVDDTGTLSAIDVQASGFNFSGNNPFLWTGGDIDWVQDVAADDALGWNGSGGPATITFTNLPGAAYVVELVASWGSANPGDYAVNGSLDAENFNDTPGVTGDDWDALLDGRNPRNWLVWRFVTPVAGEIQITLDDEYAPGMNGVAVANALRLTAIPAEIVTGNGSAQPTPPATFAEFPLAQPFQPAGEAYVLSHVDLLVTGFPPPLVRLHADAGGVPGTALATFDSPPTTGAPLTTFSYSGPQLVLQPFTQYWVEMAPDGVTHWSRSGADPTGPGAMGANESFWNPAGTWQVVPAFGRFIATVYGVPTGEPVEPVPVLGGVARIALAGALIAGLAYALAARSAGETG